MSRIAAKNGVSAQAFGQDMGIPFSAVIDGNPDAIGKLATLTNVSCEDILAWSPQNNGKRQHSFRGEIFHALGIKHTVIRGCPVCLREDAAASGGAVLCGIGFGAMLPNLMTHFLSDVPARLRGRGAGMVTAAIFGGQFLSPLASVLVLHFMPLNSAFGLLGALSLGFGLIFGISVAVVHSPAPSAGP